MTLSPDFTTAMVSFIQGCQRIHTEHIEKHYTNVAPDTISTLHGRRYVKIVRTRAGGVGGSVHCFVDTTNGDVLLPASWKAPAKHARGNIFDPNNSLGLMGEYGPAYLR